MAVEIFGFTTPSEILENIISDNKRGFKADLAKAIKCHPSHLSQVLNQTVSLTIDQGYAATIFFNYNEVQTNYFLLLLQRERSATRSLRAYYTNQIKAIIADQKVIAKRIKSKPDEFLKEHKEEYYSAWFYSAIHIALTIPKINSVNELSEMFNIPVFQIVRVLELLKKMNLIENKHQRWTCKQNSIHIPSYSPLNKSYHQNWRNYFNMRIQEQRDNEIHYTAVHSLSKQDAAKLQDIILKMVDSTRKVVAPSKEENLVVIGIDFCSF